MASVPQRKCKQCGTTYQGDEIEAMFAVAKYTSQPTLNPTCNACLLTARTEAKEVNRFLTKAKSTIGHHAKKFSEERPNSPRWLFSDRPIVELTDRFLWDIKRIAHDMEHAWQNGCNDCGYAFKTMPNGMHDLTLDIINPTQPPYYGTNTRFICTTCNRKKSRTPSHLWGAMKAAWARWKKRQEWLAAQPKWCQAGLWNDEDERSPSN